MTAVRIPHRWGTFSVESLFGYEPPEALAPGGLAYALSGRSGVRPTLVQGGITAHRHVADVDTERPGWWRAVVGPGAALDLDHHAVLGVDYLGGIGDSAGARLDDRGTPLPVTTLDQAHALVAVLDALCLEKVDVIGASYGGMVALALAALRPERVERLLVVSAAHRTHPMATALRSLQRGVLDLGTSLGAPERAIELARGIGMTTYRTANEFSERFGTDPVWDSGRPRFPVEDYLAHHGRKAADGIGAEVLRCLSESIDSHSVQPEHVRCPVTLVSVLEDGLVPPWLAAELASRLGGPCTEVVVSSTYGHDAFLKDEQVARIVRDFVEGGAR